MVDHRTLLRAYTYNKVPVMIIVKELDLVDDAPLLSAQGKKVNIIISELGTKSIF